MLSYICHQYVAFVLKSTYFSWKVPLDCQIRRDDLELQV